MIGSFKPTILIILEPKISRVEADKACRRIRRHDWVRFEVNSFNRGIWILWNREEIKLEVIHVEKYFIHLLVGEGNGRVWEMSTVYASPSHHNRLMIWELSSIKHNYPWVLLGDFYYALNEGSATTLEDP